MVFCTAFAQSINMGVLAKDHMVGGCTMLFQVQLAIPEFDLDGLLEQRFLVIPGFLVINSAQIDKTNLLVDFTSQRGLDMILTSLPHLQAEFEVL